MTVVVVPYRMFLIKRIQDAFGSASADEQGAVRTLFAGAGLGTAPRHPPTALGGPRATTAKCGVRPRIPAGAPCLEAGGTGSGPSYSSAYSPTRPLPPADPEETP